MSRPVDAVSGARFRRTIGLRPLLFLSNMSLVVLATFGALGVVLAYQQRDIEDTGRAVLRSSLARTEAEVRKALEPVEDTLIMSRDWIANGIIDLQQPDELARHIVPLFARDKMVGAAVFMAGGATMRFTRHANGWVSQTVRTADANREITTAQWDAAGERAAADVRESEAKDMPAPDWYEPALAMCRARNDSNLSSEPDVYWTLPRSTPESPLHMVMAVAAGDVPDEVVVGFEISLSCLADAFLSLVPSPGGVSVIITFSGHVIGMSGLRYSSEVIREAVRTEELKETENRAAAIAYDYWRSNQTDSIFQIRDGDQSVWAAFREAWLGKSGRFFLGVIAPEEDLTAVMRNTRRDVLMIGAWGVVVAACLAGLLGAALRRPLKTVPERLTRFDALDVEDRFWPTTRISEIDALLQAVDEFSAAHSGAAPATGQAGKAPAVSEPPSVQFQAVFAARRELREAREAANRLQAEIRELITRQGSLRERAAAQRAELAAFLRGEARHTSDTKAALRLFNEMAARVLQVSEVSLWSVEPDGVLTCLDSFHSLDNRHAAGALLSKAEHPELFDAIERDVAVSINDLTGERWMQRLAAALGIAASPAALLACPVRSRRGITALALVIHREDRRDWQPEEESQAILFSQILAPLLVSAPLEEGGSKLRDIAATVLRDQLAAMIVDGQQTISWASPLLLAWLGRRETEVVGNTLSRVFADAYEGAGRRAWENLERGAASETFETCVVESGGSQRHLQAYWAAVRKNGEPLLGVVGAFFDVTSCREDARAARVIAGRLQDDMDAAPLVFWRADARGRLVYVNRAVCDVYGHSPQEFEGTPFSAFGPAAQGPQDQERILHLPSNGDRVQWFSTHSRRDGAEFAVQIAARTMLDGPELERGSVGVIVPVDEELRLADLAHLLGFLGERDEYIALGADQEGVILWISVAPELQERYEFEFQGVAGQSILHFFRSLHIEDQIETFRKAIESQSVARSVFAAQFAGGCYEQEGTFLPLPTRTGIKVVIFIRDVTASAP